jgi:hypothetical protein
MPDQEARWVVRLTPVPDSNLDLLIAMPLGLDVWERHPDHVVAAVTDAQLAEIERRNLAQVERLCTVAEYISRPPDSGGSKPCNSFLR